MKNELINILLNRFDIIVKYLYIKGYIEGKDKEFYIELYKKHIKLYNGGIEDDKKNIDDFINSFNSLIENFKNNGFNKNYPIPVNENSYIVNGAHRLACCLYFGIDPIFENVKFDGNLKWGFEWFKNNFDENEFLFLLGEVSNFLNLDIIILWNNYFDKCNDLKKVLKQNNIRVVGDYDLEFNRFNFTELINDIYSYDGPILKDTIYEKSVGLLNYKSIIKLIILGNNIKKDKKELKYKLREKILKQGDKIFDTFHWGEDEIESNYLKELFFSYNNIKYLKMRKTIVNNSFLKLLNGLNKFIAEEKLDKNDICIVGSGPLGVFGINKVSDIDIIKKEISNKGIIKKGNIDILDYQYYDKLENKDMIESNLYNFYFRGFKFLDLKILKNVKLKGLREKDLLQVKKIDNFLKQNKGKEKIIDKIKFYLKFLKAKTYVKILNFGINFTKKIGIYEKASYFWRKYILKNIK